MCANTNKNVSEKQAMGRSVDRWTDLTPKELKKIPGLVAVYVVLQLPQNVRLFAKSLTFWTQ